MTDRERWTVYPLIFLTLGIAMRSKFDQSLEVSEIDCRKLRCGELFVLSPDGKVRVVARAVPDEGGASGEIVIVGPNDRQQLGMRGTSQGGFVESRAPDGRLQVVVRPTPLGGSLETWLNAENGPKPINFPLDFLMRRVAPTENGSKPHDGGKPDGKPVDPNPPPASETQPSNETPAQSVSPSQK